MKGFPCGIRGEARTNQTRPYRTTGAASADHRPGQNSPPRARGGEPPSSPPQERPRTRERSGVSSQRQKVPQDQQLDLQFTDNWIQNSPTEPVRIFGDLSSCRSCMYEWTAARPVVVAPSVAPAEPPSPRLPRIISTSSDLACPTHPHVLPDRPFAQGEERFTDDPHQRFLLWAQRLAQWVGHSTAKPVGDGSRRPLRDRDGTDRGWRGCTCR